MAFPQGIDFRATSGYVTDPANCDYEVSTGGNYPRTSAQGNTVGWEDTGLTTRNRNSSNPPKLAGAHFNPAGTVKTYRIDLPATGSYNVRIAAGDATYANPVKVELFDTTTSLGVLASTTPTAANKFRDATNAEHTAANWEANNTAFNASFASTICRFKNGGASSCLLAHLWIESAGGAATHTTSGALTSVSSAVAGSSAHISVHGTSGSLAGQSSFVVGSSIHNIPHPTSGVLAGQVSSIVGTAARKRAMASSGVLSGQTSSVVGAASRSTGASTHATSGVLTGAIGSIAGSATRYRQFIASGSLAGQPSSVIGSAVHRLLHATSGALSSSGALISGVSSVNKVHTSVGVLSSQPSVMVGSAAKALILSTVPSIYIVYVGMPDTSVALSTIDNICYVDIYNNRIEI